MLATVSDVSEENDEVEYDNLIGKSCFNICLDGYGMWLLRHKCVNVAKT